ncbi:hypothetical protein [Phenylobacterium sp. J367]|uniref:hypothetical protein n=1 Tax=Phenylobacterium sp. J367 TaxID=2898435 RepID=UPI002150EF89|nr:hypothetical protein [Phenylobacterium sp. J367]MCR5878795.1 hypothetical protein [Phenylobacterium sp. J367]
MKHVDQRGGIYRVRMVIPPAARHAFPHLPASGDYAVSLRTRDEAVAFMKAPPIIADLKQRIAAALQASPQPVAQTTPAIYRPAEVRAAIERWRVAAINAAQADHFSGAAPVIPMFGDEAMAISDLRHKLASETTFDQIADFEDRLRGALASEGLEVSAGHPLLSQPAARAWFGRAWASVERHTEQFRRGVFKDWPEDGAQETPQQPPAPQSIATASVTMKALVDRYVAAKKPKSEDDLRYHWRRLVERVGDVAVEAVTPDALEAFLIDLRRFPKTRRPDIAKLGFDEILAKHGDVAPPIAEPTVWKHFVSYGQVFNYALMMRLIPFNPVAAVMPSKPKPTKPVRAYTPDEIATLFAKPMFTGCSKTHNRKGDLHGYRSVPGAIVLKDGRYWMPILNLFHGNRMEEWGGAKVADIKCEGQINYLDLTQRALKNDTANRLLPLHPKLVALGFLDYVAERRIAGDVYLFPEFPHDMSEADDPEASTRQFTKWWGLWSDANGFSDPTVNFHSFRHTFKRACRGVISEEISDLITGHKGIGGAGRGYGAGADLALLAEAIRRVDYPTFALNR